MTEIIGNQNYPISDTQTQVLNMLDTYEKKLGLPSNILDDHESFKSYLNMDISQLEKLDAAQCSYICYKLSQLSLYLQRILNREEAMSRTLKNKINSIIAKKVTDYPQRSWELQRAAAISDNDVTQQLQVELIESEAKQDSLKNLSLGIRDMADHMKTIQYAKNRN